MESNIIKIPYETNMSLQFSIQEAVLFAKIVSGTNENPENNMMGKIKTIAEIKESNMEYFQGSVIDGDTAYEVKEGFIITPVEQKQHASIHGESSEKQTSSKNISEKLAESTEKKQEEKKPEELLAELLLEKLK